MNNILLSVIVPVYGVEKYIEKCLESIFPQLTDQTELIVVNDCTPDQSIFICEDIFAKYPDKNMQIVHRKENGGLSEARNTGIDVAQGKYCWFVDSDDSILEGAIRGILEQLKDSSLDLLCFNHERVTEDGEIVLESQVVPKQMQLDIKKKKLYILGQYLTNYWGFEVWRKIFSLEIIKKYNIKFESNKEIFAEDICFFLYYLNYCRNIRGVSDIYYSYLIRGNSIMGKKTSKINEMINLAKKVANHPDRIQGFNYLRYVLPRLLDIEFGAATDYITEMCNMISDKNTVIQACKYPLLGFGKRIYLYGKKNTLKQVVLMMILSREFREKPSLRLKQLYTYVKRVL